MILSSAKSSLALHARGLFLRVKANPVLRNNGIYITGSLLAGLFGYIFHFESGRLLGPSGYAVVASAIAALYLLTLPVVVLQSVSVRYTSLASARQDPASIRSLLVRISSLSLLVAAPMALLLLVFAHNVAQYLNIADVRVIYVLIPATLMTLLIAINRGALQGLRRFFALSANVLLDMVSRVVFVAMLVLLGFGAVGAVAAVLLGPAIAYVQSLQVLRRLTSYGPGLATTEGLGGYAVLAAVAGIGVNYLFSIDTLLAKHYLSSESAGIYAAAAVLARGVYFLGLSVAAVMFPEVAALHARDEAHFHVVDLSLLLVGCIGAALVVAYLAFPGLVLLPYGPSFTPVASYLGTFAVALAMLALANLLINYFLSIARASFIAPLLGACALETVLIVLFHSSIWQIVTMVVVSLGLLSLVMGVLYAGDRFAMKRVRQ